MIRHLSKAQVTLFVVVLVGGITTAPLHAATIGFGTGWGLPGTISFETPIGSPFPGSGGSPIEDTFFELDGQASVSKFHPDWGTLNSVSLTIFGSGLYSYDYSPEIPPSGLFANSASFTATISVQGDGIFLTDSATGGSPGQGGTLIPEVESIGSGSTSAFTGFGQFTLDLHHELTGDIFVDEDMDGFGDAGWSGGLTGIFSGLMIVTYDYTPATSPDGGPPGGEGSCLSCGPLPGDANLDDFVGIDDLSTVLINWNQNVVGVNNGDFNADGFIGIDDLNIVLSNWNAGTPPGASAVPEPASVGLLCGSLTLAFGRPRRSLSIR